jgi:hypothetical protein
MSLCAFFCCLTDASQARWDALEQAIQRRRIVREAEAVRARLWTNVEQEFEFVIKTSHTYTRESLERSMRRCAVITNIQPPDGF